MATLGRDSPSDADVTGWGAKAALAALVATCPPAQARAAPGPAAATAAPAAPDRLSVVATAAARIWNGVAVAPDGRVFVVYPRAFGDPGPSLALRQADGSFKPYPGGSWNDWTPSPPMPKHGKAGKDATDPDHATRSDLTRRFVALNAARIGPDGALWVLDTGVPSMGAAPLPGGPKIVRIDLAHGSVSRIYAIDPAALRPKSMIDDLRFHDGRAYITDAGAAGLIVLDLQSGAMRRVLDGDPALTARRPVVIDGKTLTGPDGKPAMINADQLEVTPDGRYLYVQPLCGPMSRIPTQALDDAKLPPEALSHEVEFWYDTPALGGTAIDAQGTLYLNDIAAHAVLTLNSERQLRTLIQDDRLQWPDAPALTASGALYLPVAQLDRSAPFNKGKSAIVPPLAIYRLQTGTAAANAAP